MKTFRNAVVILGFIILGLFAANSAQAATGTRVALGACQQGFWNTTDGVKLFYIDTTTETPIVFWPTSGFDSKQLWFMAAGAEQWTDTQIQLGLYQGIGPFNGPYVNDRVGTFTLFPGDDNKLWVQWLFSKRIPGLCESAGFSPPPPSCHAYQPIELVQVTRPVGCE